jgi:hypothetical protein
VTDQDQGHRSKVIAAARWGVTGLAATAWVATEARWINWPAAGTWLAQHKVSLGWAALIVLLASWAAWRAAPRRVVDGLTRWRSRSGGNTPTATQPPLNWWIVVAAAVVVAAVAWGATKGLLHVANAAKDPAAAQVEAIKTGLSIAAGTGGVFALLLAVRRQWHQEVSTAADSAHRERVAASTEADASARRVTEQYTKAADQLGSDKAQVRLAGLYALERLAQDNPDLRQTIVNVICAYLRMPYVPPPVHIDTKRSLLSPESWLARSAKPDPGVQEELEVRTTAQRILFSHLTDTRDEAERLITPPHPHHWAGISINLSGATLVDADLWYANCFSADFTGTIFTGNTSFFYAKFDDIAKFDKATFQGFTSFVGAIFNRHAWFKGTSFSKGVALAGATFKQQAVLYDTSFSGHLGLEELRFENDIFLQDPTFEDNYKEFDQTIVCDLTANFHLPDGWQVKNRGDGTGYLAPPPKTALPEAASRLQITKDTLLQWMHDLT